MLCYDGYLTPQNPHNQQHCIGASYHRGDESTVWREEDQRQNRQRLLDCFPDAKWATEVDVSGNSARCGVRCATRDHLPMVGNVPDYHATLTHYADLADNKRRRRLRLCIRGYLCSARWDRVVCAQRHYAQKFWRRR